MHSNVLLRLGLNAPQCLLARTVSVQSIHSLRPTELFPQQCMEPYPAAKETGNREQISKFTPSMLSMYRNLKKTNSRHLNNNVGRYSNKLLVKIITCAQTFHY